MWRRIFTLAVAMVVLTVLGCSASGGQEPYSSEGAGAAKATAAVPADPVVAAAGDIACDPDSSYFSGSNPKYCQDKETADLVRRINPGTVIALGDTQYTDSTSAEYAKSYDRSWGKPDIKGITKPVVGNHEYQTTDAKGYRTYFGNPGDSDLAYSYKLGDWRIFAANSNCAELSKPGRPGSCSSQADWIKKTMTDSPTKCTLLAFHHPRRTNVAKHYPGTTTVSGLEQAFYDKRGEVILNGHAHSIEVSNKITPGGSNSSVGVKHFTIGSGGKESGLPWQGSKPGWTDYRNKDEHAVLKLTLHPTSYDYQIIDIDDNILNQGTRNCV